MDFYNISSEELIIVYDDIDTEPGTIRIRKVGSAGSHNGMKSVIQNISTEEFARIRVGIGRPEHTNDMINYVIGYIPENELKILDEGCTLAKEAVVEFIKNGLDSAMNKFNKRK